MAGNSIWVVRAGDNNEIANEVEQSSAVAIGWREIGDLRSTKTREEIKARYRQAYPDHSEKHVISGASQLFRFAYEIAEGDLVLTPIKATREVLVGKIAGPYAFDSKRMSVKYPHIRPVEWMRKVSRDDFTLPARNSIGGASTIFSVTTHQEEILKLAEGKRLEPDHDRTDDTADDFYQTTKTKADDLISDIISHIDPYDFQDLVAGVLQAMGFRTRVSPRGADQGVDIVAYPDPLGFEGPRIKIQVKHKKSSVGGPDLRNFIATLGDKENGLFVSTGGFTRDAEIEVAKGKRTITLVDRDAFVELLQEHYEKLKPEYRTMVPLKQVYIPVRE
ncbi:MAG: restriction endonuclease [Candidatus Binatia bacterium]